MEMKTVSVSKDMRGIDSIYKHNVLQGRLPKEVTLVLLFKYCDKSCLPSLYYDLDGLRAQ